MRDYSWDLLFPLAFTVWSSIFLVRERESFLFKGNNPRYQHNRSAKKKDITHHFAVYKGSYFRIMYFRYRIIYLHAPYPYFCCPLRSRFPSYQLRLLCCNCYIPPSVAWKQVWLIAVIDFESSHIYFVAIGHIQSRLYWVNSFSWCLKCIIHVKILLLLRPSDKISKI